MINNKNIILPVMTILKKSYLMVFNNIKIWLIYSYILAIPIFLLSTVLSQLNYNFLSLSFYITICFIVLISINIFFYRVFALPKKDLFKIDIGEFIKSFLKMATYLLALLCVLFLAILTLGLLLGLIVSIVEEVAGKTALSEALLTTLVTIVMLVFILLITMRVQPTFISIALNKAILPMKSAYYYTRDNNRRIIIIGLLSFIPAMIPSIVGVMIIDVVGPSDLLSYFLFPFLLLPSIIIISSGITIYELLVPEDLENENYITDITV